MESSSKSDPNPHISVYTHLPDLEHADEALRLIHSIASMAKPIMRKRNWKVGTLAEFLPDNPLLHGLNENWGQTIYVRLRPQADPKSFYDMSVIMDTMLHELAHIVHGEHDKAFYALLEQLKLEWDLLSSKGYRGEGFFSQGQRLGKGHMWYKPSLAVSSKDRKQVKEMAERKARGLAMGGVTLGGRGVTFGGVEVTPEGRRLGGTGSFEGLDIDPRSLAAMAAEQRATDQRRCGAKHGGKDMKRERDRADKYGKRTQVKDIPNIVDLNDIQNYDLEDSLPTSLGPVPVSNGFGRSSAPISAPAMTNSGIWQSDWICTQCTFKNQPLFLACDVCGAERVLQGDPDLIDLTVDSGSDSWDCQACTFRNENVAGGICCTVCGTEK